MADETSLNVMAAELEEVANAIMVTNDHAAVKKLVESAIATFESLKKTPDMKQWALTLRVSLYEFKSTVADWGDLNKFFSVFQKAFEETAKLTKNKTILAHFESILQKRMNRAIRASERKPRAA